MEMFLITASGLSVPVLKESDGFRCWGGQATLFFNSLCSSVPKIALTILVGDEGTLCCLLIHSKTKGKLEHETQVQCVK